MADDFDIIEITDDDSSDEEFVKTAGTHLEQCEGKIENKSGQVGSKNLTATINTGKTNDEESSYYCQSKSGINARNKGGEASGHNDSKCATRKHVTSSEESNDMAANTSIKKRCTNNLKKLISSTEKDSSSDFEESQSLLTPKKSSQHLSNSEYFENSVCSSIGQTRHTTQNKTQDKRTEPVMGSSHCVAGKLSQQSGSVRNILSEKSKTEAKQHSRDKRRHLKQAKKPCNVLEDSSDSDFQETPVKRKKRVKKLEPKFLESSSDSDKEFQDIFPRIKCPIGFTSDSRSKKNTNQSIKKDSRSKKNTNQSIQKVNNTSSATSDDGPCLDPFEANNVQAAVIPLGEDGLSYRVLNADRLKIVEFQYKVPQVVLRDVLDTVEGRLYTDRCIVNHRESALSGQHTVSSGHPTASGRHHTVSSRDHTVSGVHQTASRTNHSVSGGHHSASGRYHTASSGQHTVSGGHQIGSGEKKTASRCDVGEHHTINTVERLDGNGKCEKHTSDTNRMEPYNKCDSAQDLCNEKDMSIINKNQSDGKSIKITEREVTQLGPLPSVKGCDRQENPASTETVAQVSTGQTEEEPGDVSEVDSMSGSSLILDSDIEVISLEVEEPSSFPFRGKSQDAKTIKTSKNVPKYNNEEDLLWKAQLEEEHSQKLEMDSSDDEVLLTALSIEEERQTKASQRTQLETCHTKASDSNSFCIEATAPSTALGHPEECSQKEDKKQNVSTTVEKTEPTEKNSKDISPKNSKTYQDFQGVYDEVKPTNFGSDVSDSKVTSSKTEPSACRSKQFDNQLTASNNFSSSHGYSHSESIELLSDDDDVQAGPDLLRLSQTVIDIDSEDDFLPLHIKQEEEEEDHMNTGEETTHVSPAQSLVSDVVGHFGQYHATQPFDIHDEDFQDTQPFEMLSFQEWDAEDAAQLQYEDDIGTEGLPDLGSSSHQAVEGLPEEAVPQTSAVSRKEYHFTFDSSESSSDELPFFLDRPSGFGKDISGSDGSKPSPKLPFKSQSVTKKASHTARPVFHRMTSASSSKSAKLCEAQPLFHRGRRYSGDDRRLLTGRANMADENSLTAARFYTNEKKTEEHSKQESIYGKAPMKKRHSKIMKGSSNSTSSSDWFGKMKRHIAEAKKTMRQRQSVSKSSTSSPKKSEKTKGFIRQPGPIARKARVWVSATSRQDSLTKDMVASKAQSWRQSSRNKKTSAGPSKNRSTSDAVAVSTLGSESASTLLPSPGDGTTAAKTMETSPRDGTTATETMVTSPGDVTTAAKTMVTSPGDGTTVSKTMVTSTGDGTTATETMVTSPRDGTTATETMVTSPGDVTTAAKTMVTSPGDKTTASKTIVTRRGDEATASKTMVTSPGDVTTAAKTMVTSPGDGTTASKTMVTSPGDGTAASKTIVTSPGDGATASKTIVTCPGDGTAASKNMVTSPENGTDANKTMVTSPGDVATAAKTMVTNPGDRTTASKTMVTSFGDGTTASKSKLTIAIDGTVQKAVPVVQEVQGSGSGKDVPSVHVTKPIGILKKPGRANGKKRIEDGVRNKVSFGERFFKEIPRRSEQQFRPVNMAAVALDVHPRSKSAPANKTKFSELKFLVNMLTKFNTRWLKECLTSDAEPPAAGEGVFLHPLLPSYSSLDDYIEIITPLMLHEIWAKAAKDWKEKGNESACQFLVLVNCNFKPALQGYMFHGLQDLIHKKALLTRKCVAEGDLVVLHMARKLKQGSIEILQVFGYVQSVTRTAIGEEQNLKELLAKKKFAGHSAADYTLFTLSVMTKWKPAFLELTDEILLKAEVVTSLTSSIRCIRGLSYLNKSLLARDFLRPTNSNVFVRSPTKLSESVPGFNESQSKVIQSLSEAAVQPYALPKIGLVQGPPGTGKSRTVVGLCVNILQKVARKQLDHYCVLLCAPSNAAIDVLTRRLLDMRKQMKVRSKADKRIKVPGIVRVGSSENVHPDIVSITLEELIKSNMGREDADLLSKSNDSMKEALAEIEVKMTSLKLKLQEEKNVGKDTRTTDEALRNLEEKKKWLCRQPVTKTRLGAKEMARRQKEHRLNILRKADIVCCTLNSSGNAVMRESFLDYQSQTNKLLFDCIIIDEASQSTELECLIPLQYGCLKLFLFGDPEQLQPTVLSQVSTERNFGQSMLERLSVYFKEKDSDTPVQFLDTQYRMHPEICHFPSLHCYHGSLKTDKSCQTKSNKCPFQPYLVFDLKDSKENNNRTGAIFNENEAEFTVDLCKFLHAMNKTFATNIGVITPYQKQRKWLEDKLKKIHLEGRLLEVNTVDGFQGREKGIIVLSCVRAQTSSGGIGFLASRQRMNVALTRAKHALYVVGHLDTLKSDKEWGALIQDARSRGLVVSVDVNSRHKDTAIRKCLKTTAS